MRRLHESRYLSIVSATMRTNAYRFSHVNELAFGYTLPTSGNVLPAWWLNRVQGTEVKKWLCGRKSNAWMQYNDPAIKVPSTIVSWILLQFRFACNLKYAQSAVIVECKWLRFSFKTRSFRRVWNQETYPMLGMQTAIITKRRDAVSYMWMKDVFDE